MRKDINILTDMIAMFVILFTGRDCLELGQHVHLRRTLLFLGFLKLVTFQMCQTGFICEVWALWGILVSV